ncbi:MAG TPA: 50S ribosomal protein L3 [Gemmatimonadaceae bacterium]|nr:50S ribosomal protein L3 [Gemmatimonadaceae bacterium]
MIGIIGKKLGMTQIFNEDGQQIPVTVIEAAPNPVLAVTDKAKVGHASVQLGYGQARLRRESKKGERTPKGRRASLAAVGHAKQAGLDVPPAVLRSIRLDEPGNAKVEIPTYSVGDVVKVDIFTVGDTVKVTGTTKGRGFQGIVKRHGAGGGPNTHGNTKHRRPGSIGPGTDPSRVIKGKRMPGHYGAERHTQTHLRVEKIDADRNLIYIRGSVAGPTNGIVVVRKQG